jgi:hypothetical protein
MDRRRLTVAGCLAMTSLFVLGVAGAGPSAGAATDVSAQSLNVVAGPVAAGNLAIVISDDKRGALSLDAVNPATDTVAWSDPYSSSEVTPGVALTPVVSGNTVVDIVPAGKPSDPTVKLAGVNAITGATEWKLGTALILPDNPALCDAGADVCVPDYESNGSSALIIVAGDSGAPKGLIPGPLRAMASNLYETDATDPTFTELSPNGTLAWTKSVSSLYGPGNDPNDGWNISPVGQLQVGTVASKGKGKVVDLSPYKTVGVLASNGDVTWSVPGAYECMGTLAMLTSQVTCQFTGSLTESTRHPLSPTLKGVTLKLKGFNPNSGATTWLLPVTNVKPLLLGMGIRFADTTHLLVSLKNGTSALLNTSSGTTSPVGDHQVLWCQTTKLFKVGIQSGSAIGAQRLSEPLSYPCNAHGKESTGTPKSFPTSVGTTINGVFVWASPEGLRTHSVAGR